MAQDAMKQALINGAIQEAYKNYPNTMQINIKKAIASIEHTFLLQCVAKLNFHHG